MAVVTSRGAGLMRAARSRPDSRLTRFGALMLLPVVADGFDEVERKKKPRRGQGRATSRSRELIAGRADVGSEDERFGLDSRRGRLFQSRAAMSCGSGKSIPILFCSRSMSTGGKKQSGRDV